MLAGVFTFFADGNVIVSGFGASQPSLQGAWSAAGEGAGTLTVVGVLVGGSGVSDGTLGRVRGAVEVDDTGEGFTGGYTFEVVGPDGRVQFTYNGPLAGARVLVEPPDPIARTLVPGTPTASGARGEAHPAWTAVRYFVPLGDGLRGGLTATATETGSCFTGSVRDPGRADAWRCEGGNAILDPCFQGPFALPEQPGELACADSPFDREVLLLQATPPLPMEAANAADPGQLPWVLELANGERCYQFGGTLEGVAGQVVHYGCAGGGSVVGEPDRSQPLWTVSYLPADGAATDLVAVTTAWY